MFRKSIEIYKPVADRIQAKIKERKLRIKIEVGKKRVDDQIIVQFQFNNYEELSRIIIESIKEECDEYKMQLYD
jgi:hypothetical protein